MTDEKMPTREDLARWRKYIGTLPKHTLIDAYEALLDERDRLKAAMTTAGLECFMKDATPQQVADHMRAVSTSWANEQKTIEALRARNEKLEAVLVAAKELLALCYASKEVPRQQSRAAVIQLIAAIAAAEEKP